jgi:hypothetical protein
MRINDFPDELLYSLMIRSETPAIFTTGRNLATSQRRLV